MNYSKSTKARNSGTTMKIKEIIVQNPPFLHFWHGQEQLGGCQSHEYLLLFEKICHFVRNTFSSEDSFRFIETGAGLSSLWLLSNGFSVTSFAVGDCLLRAKEFLEEHEPKLLNNWTFFDQPSEFGLMQYALNKELEHSYHITFIDGNHALPTVCSDFLAFNLVLKEGGLLIVDDIGLPGPNLLCQFLIQEGSYKRLFKLSTNKAMVFRKDKHTKYPVGNHLHFKFSFDTKC